MIRPFTIYLSQLDPKDGKRMKWFAELMEQRNKTGSRVSVSVSSTRWHHDDLLHGFEKAVRSDKASKR